MYSMYTDVLKILLFLEAFYFTFCRIISIVIFNDVSKNNQLQWINKIIRNDFFRTPIETRNVPLNNAPLIKDIIEFNAMKQINNTQRERILRCKDFFGSVRSYQCE